MADKISQFPSIPIKTAAEYILKTYSSRKGFHLWSHEECRGKFSNRTIVNIFYNNTHKLVCDSVRKDTVKGFKKRQREKINNSYI